MATSGSSSRIVRAASSPSAVWVGGIRMSTTTRSGTCSRTSARRGSPSPACPTTSKPGRASRLANPSRSSTSSSARTTRKCRAIDVESVGGARLRGHGPEYGPPDPIAAPARPRSGSLFTDAGASLTGWPSSGPAWSPRSHSRLVGASSGSRSRRPFWPELPSADAVVVGMTVVDVLARPGGRLLLGHPRRGTGRAWPSVVALDWHYIPPTHESAVPDGRNAGARGLPHRRGAAGSSPALAARRRAEVSERARAQLADEQAALRRVATLRRAGDLSRGGVRRGDRGGRASSRIDIATMLRYESSGARPSSRPGAGNGPSAHPDRAPVDPQARTSPPW